LKHKGLLTLYFTDAKEFLKILYREIGLRTEAYIFLKHWLREDKIRRF